MHRIRLIALASVCGGVLAAPALAASDYYLKIGGIDGESNERAAAASVEVSSFSWGASNAGAARVGGGTGAGKASMQDLSATDVVAPRDAASGLPTGKRQHKPVRAAEPDASADHAAAVAAGELRSLTVVVPDSASATAKHLERACADGKHIEKAELRGPGQAFALRDIVVTSCSAAGKERRYELKGHVTLIK